MGNRMNVFTHSRNGRNYPESSKLSEKEDLTWLSMQKISLPIFS